MELSRADARDCRVCRNAQNWAYPGKDKGELENKLNGPDESEYQSYMVVVFLWEDKYNDPKGAVVKLTSNIPGFLKTQVSATYAYGSMAINRGFGD